MYVVNMNNADDFTLTNEIFKGKLHFLQSFTEY